MSIKNVDAGDFSSTDHYTRSHLTKPGQGLGISDTQKASPVPGVPTTNAKPDTTISWTGVDAKASERKSQTIIRSKLIADLISPETFQAAQGLVEMFEFLRTNTTDLFDRQQMARQQTVDQFTDFIALVGQADTN